MDDRAEPIAAYAFGVLHALLLLLLLVALLMRTDAGAEPLAAIGTGGGIAIGAWLAMLSVASTTWALRGVPLSAPDRRKVIERAGLGGFVAGALFVGGVVLGFQLAAGRIEPPTLVFLLFASPFAGAFGTLVAVALALLDLGIHRLARGIVARTAR